MAGSDKRHAHCVNKRSEFWGNKEHIQLARMIFPCSKMAEATLLDDSITPRECFIMLKNLRWIILQDSAVLIEVHNRKHSVYEYMPGFFNQLHSKVLRI